DLKRALAFYHLPEHSHLLGIKSYTSTVNYTNKFMHLEKYIFIDNHLEVDSKSLGMISDKMINEALDRARDHDSPNSYMSLFYMLNLWLSLSVHKLLPEALRLDVPLEKIVVPERRAEIYGKMRATLQPWVPFSEDDLSHMMEYALFWVEKATPELAKIEPGILQTLRETTNTTIIRKKQDLEFEARFEVKVDEKIIMQTTRILSSHPSRGDSWRYTWRMNWGVALDHVRNAVFILIALVTGARASELAPLSITDIANDKPDGKGDYWIRIVRWKTAPDPNYNGEVEHLPLPHFVAESAFAYDKLRNIGRKNKRHWLFQSNRNGSPSTAKTVKPTILVALIDQLKEHLPIERIHVHRFRKTIAEILINQDERNIDLIRALFGHKTFKMTMQYISRNPAMVRSVALSLEQSYTHELQEIIEAIRIGAYSGQAATRLSDQIKARPEEFEGRKIQISLLEYVTNLLMGGHPLFIKRTAVGTYCVTAEHFNPATLPPCIQGRDFGDELPRPDPTNCHYDCRKIVVLEKAKAALEQNLIFYQRILDNPKTQLPAAMRNELQAKIESYQFHLANLSPSNLHQHNSDFLDQLVSKESQPNLISAVHLHE
ncbi:tyrosine-type recombinase/integrase, partial [Pseudomonas sp. R81]|uniref:tyrosine-type recombinase/integrase n=1 Tax=Pseudomonas sp. R81 TaxID=1144885 RepID=UPI00029B399B